MASYEIEATLPCGQFVLTTKSDGLSGFVCNKDMTTPVGLILDGTTSSFWIDMAMGKHEHLEIVVSRMLKRIQVLEAIIVALEIELEDGIDETRFTLNHQKVMLGIETSKTKLSFKNLLRDQF